MRLEVSCANRPGMAREILDTLSGARINVLSGEFASERYIYLHTPDMSFNQLQRILPQIRAIDGVDDIHPIPLMPSEKREAEQQTLLDALPETILSVDLEGRVLAANQAAAELLQLGPGQLSGFSLEGAVGNLSLVELIHQHDGLVTGVRLEILGRRLQADLRPIRVPVGSLGYSLTGAVITLKRPSVVGADLSEELADFSRFFCRQPSMKQLVTRARRMAKADARLLIEGETGTGKRLLAEACHLASQRAARPFVVLDCTAVSDRQLEEVLFGSAEQGGQPEQRGLLEQAVGGTLFLNHIEDMSALLQRRLLRFVSEGRFRRCGSGQELFADVRIIAGCSRELQALVSEGGFRSDLGFMLSTLRLSIPPLRQRREELPALAEQLLAELCRQQQLPRPDITPATRQLLLAAPWPGNVRELKNQLLQGLLSLEEGEALQPQHLGLSELPAVSTADIRCEGSLEEAVSAFESQLLQQLYPSYPSSRLLAARLGMSHTAVARKLRTYGISKSVNRAG